MNTEDKPTFFAIWNAYQLKDSLLWTIANMAGVSKGVVDKIVLGEPVMRAEAVKVLVACSHLTNRTWTLGNVDIPLMDAEKKQLTAKPTFSDIWNIYEFNDNVFWEIAKSAKVGKSVLDMLYIGAPVERKDVLSVLSAIAKVTGTDWRLDNTDIPVVDMEEEHG